MVHNQSYCSWPWPVSLPRSPTTLVIIPIISTPYCPVFHRNMCTLQECAHQANQSIKGSLRWGGRCLAHILTTPCHFRHVATPSPYSLLRTCSQDLLICSSKEICGHLLGILHKGLSLQREKPVTDIYFLGSEFYAHMALAFTHRSRNRSCISLNE